METWKLFHKNKSTDSKWLHNRHYKKKVNIFSSQCVQYVTYFWPLKIRCALFWLDALVVVSYDSGEDHTGCCLLTVSVLHTEYAPWLTPGHDTTF